MTPVIGRENSQKSLQTEDPGTGLPPKSYSIERVKKGCRGVKKKSINSTSVTMCEKGVSGGGVNIKDPKSLYVMECQWGGEG